MARAGRRVSGERVAIALGSNLGDRAGHLAWALEALAASIDNLRASPFAETAPVDVPEPQPDYLNAVAIGRTTLAPHRLLDVLLALEAERGRIRTGWHAARTLDLDLLLYDDLTMTTDDLTLPHPRFHERAFVLVPLAELEPGLQVPGHGKAGELLAGVDASGVTSWSNAE